MNRSTLVLTAVLVAAPSTPALMQQAADPDGQAQVRTDAPLIAVRNARVDRSSTIPATAGRTCCTTPRALEASRFHPVTSAGAPYPPTVQDFWNCMHGEGMGP